MEKLISDDGYNELPDDDDQCFVAFEVKAHARLNAMLQNESPTDDYYQTVKSQYMSAVYSAANACHITTLPAPQFEDSINFYKTFNMFELAVQGEVARIRVRGRRSIGITSVQLLDNTKTIIRHHVSRLRDIISAADLPPDRKEALNRKLEELVEALENRRLNLGKVMLALGYVVAGLASATTIASEGPAALVHIQNAVIAIMTGVGADKMSEDAAKLRLAPPLKALPAPPPPVEVVAARANRPSWDTPRGGDLDDDIPF